MVSLQVSDDSGGRTHGSPAQEDVRIFHCAQHIRGVKSQHSKQTPHSQSHTNRFHLPANHFMLESSLLYFIDCSTSIISPSQHELERPIIMEAAARYSLDRLASWNLNFDDIIKCFRPLTPSETAFLVGSVPEGLSDPLSDIDLIVIADNDLGHEVVVQTPECEESVARLPSGQEVNFEYWNSEDLENFVQRLNASMDTLDDPSKLNKLFRFGDRELMLLHRIRAGLALANPEVAEHWRKRLRLELLPDYFIIMHLGHHYGYREDAIAQVQYGDRLAALNVMRMSMDNLAAAMLCSVGATNPYTKWRTRLLEQHKEELGPAEVDTLMGFLFPDINADAATVVREAAAFADEAIGAAIMRRPQLIPVLMKLEDQISFVRRFSEIPDSLS